MSDFDVSMRLRLINDLSKEARKAESDLKDIGDAAKKLGNVRTGNLDKSLADVGKKAGAAGKDIKGLQKDIDKLGKARIDGNLGRQIDGMVKPSAALNVAMGPLKDIALGALAALGGFASVDNIVRGLERLSDQYRKLNRDIASVAITAEMRTPEAMAKIGKSNEKLSIRYGYDQMAVNAARKTYAAAGFDIDQQEAILDPTLKASQASDTPTENMAAAMIAAQENLGVKNGEVPAALDMMSKGSKLGRFEIKDMAKNFPALATMLAGTGRQGLAGWSELVALSQVVNTSASSPDNAADNLRNLLAKLTSKDTVGNFEKKGVSLPALRNRAEKQGKPYLTAVMDEVQKLTGGDEFKINELFGDQQAYLALSPLLTKRQMYEDFLKQIKEDAAGTVDLDWQFSDTLAQIKAQQREAALQATGDKIGGAWATVTDPMRNKVTGWINPDFASQEEVSRREKLKALGPDELQRRIGDIDQRLGTLPSKDFDRFMPAVGLVREGLLGNQQEMRGVLSEITGQPANTQESYPWKKLFLGEAAKPDFNFRDAMSINLRPTAENSMQGYNNGLAAEGEKATAEAASIAERIKTILGFTVAPTISPNFTPPAAAATGEKHSSLQQSSNVKLTQNISSPNPKLAAIRSRREQDRAIRQAQARSLYDIGSIPT